MGGSTIKAALTEPGGSIFRKAHRPTLAEAAQQQTIDQIHSCIDELLKHADSEGQTVSGIGIGVPGTIDIERGVVYHPPNLPAWKEVPLAEELRSVWNMDVHLDNDANCAALGEAHYGAGREVRNFIGLTLGTGVGSGIIIDHRVFHGDHGFAGEFGHITIDHNGTLCNCGSRGCIEAYVGIHYMMREAVPELCANATSSLHERAMHDPESLLPKDLSDAATVGDPMSAALLRRAGERLGYAIATAVNLLDIATFIIGGGIAAAGDVLFEGIREGAQARVLRVHRDHLRIIPAETGNDAGMLGAAALLM
jgi:glucokinase